MRRKENGMEGRKENLFFLPFFSPFFAVPLLSISQRVYSSTTAVTNGLRSVQKIKRNKQKGEYWFPCDQIKVNRKSTKLCEIHS